MRHVFVHVHMENCVRRTQITTTSVSDGFRAKIRTVQCTVPLTSSLQDTRDVAMHGNTLLNYHNI